MPKAAVITLMTKNATRIRPRMVIQSDAALATVSRQVDASTDWSNAIRPCRMDSPVTGSGRISDRVKAAAANASIFLGSLTQTYEPVNGPLTGTPHFQET